MDPKKVNTLTRYLFKYEFTDWQMNKAKEISVKLKAVQVAAEGDVVLESKGKLCSLIFKNDAPAAKSILENINIARQERANPDINCLFDACTHTILKNKCLC